MTKRETATLSMIRSNVHQGLDYSLYESSTVQSYTNALSHAIGSTVIASPNLYRLGMLSEKKPLNEEYSSKEEVKDLFLSDLEAVKLKVQELPFENKHSFLLALKAMHLQYNEHIVVLFIKKYADGKIHDFHAIRYDKEHGWTEKRPRRNVYFFEDIDKEWPTFWTETVGAFKITR